MNYLRHQVRCIGSTLQIDLHGARESFPRVASTVCVRVYSSDSTIASKSSEGYDRQKRHRRSDSSANSHENSEQSILRPWSAAYEVPDVSDSSLSAFYQMLRKNCPFASSPLPLYTISVPQRDPETRHELSRARLLMSKRIVSVASSLVSRFGSRPRDSVLLSSTGVQSQLSKRTFAFSPKSSDSSASPVSSHAKDDSAIRRDLWPSVQRENHIDLWSDHRPKKTDSSRGSADKKSKSDPAPYSPAAAGLAAAGAAATGGAPSKPIAALSNSASPAKQDVKSTTSTSNSNVSEKTSSSLDLEYAAWLADQQKTMEKRRAEVVKKDRNEDFQDREEESRVRDFRRRRYQENRFFSRR